jgi:hypothetical protein
MVLVGDAEKRMITRAPLKKYHGRPIPRVFGMTIFGATQSRLAGSTVFCWCPPDVTTAMDHLANKKK